MKYKNIPDLYLIKGKIVFRKHIKANGKELNIWKTIGKPEDHSEEELREIANKLRNKFCGHTQNENKSKTEKSNTSKKNDKKPLTPLYFFSSKEDNKKQPSFKEILDKFFAWYSAVRKRSSYERELYRAKNLLRFFGRNYPLTKIGIKEVEEYKIYRLNQGVKKSTINKDLRLLSTIINRAVEFGWIESHVLYKKPLLIDNVKNERVRYLTKEEEERLFSVLNNSKNRLLRNIVLFAIHTGMRLGEILNLTWDNINFENRLIILFPEQTKNGKRHLIPMNKVVYEILKEEESLKVAGCPYVFHRNGRKVKSIRDGFRNALRKAKIEDFRFHDLRHTFASRLVQKGIDLYVVKELLNHSSVTITERYAHLRLENMRKAVEILEKEFD